MQNRNLRNIRAPKNQKGLTLIELAVGLAIVLAITALVVGVYTTTARSQRTNDVQTQLTQIASQVRSLAPSGNFDGITQETLADSRKVPEAWVSGADGAWQINNPFGGTYTILAASSQSETGTDTNAFKITVSNLPVAACNDIITNSQANFIFIKAGSQNVKAYGAAAADAAAIATACSAADPITVEFVAA